MPSRIRQKPDVSRGWFLHKFNPKVYSFLKECFLVQLGGRGGGGDRPYCGTEPKDLPQSFPGVTGAVSPGKQGATSRNLGLPSSEGVSGCRAEPARGNHLCGKARSEQRRRVGNNNGRYPPPHFTSPQIFRAGRF